MRRKPRKVYRRKTALKRKSFKTAVKRQIVKMAPHKEIRYNAELDFGAYNTTAWSTNALQLITPVTGVNQPIVQGTGEGERLGNRVKMTKCVLDLMLLANKYDVAANTLPGPQLVQVIVFSSKQDPNSLLTSLSQLYDNGSSSSNPTGYIGDAVYPINTDRYTVYYRKSFKLGFGDYINDGIANTAWIDYANNDFKLFHKLRIDCTKWIGSVLKFNDATNIPNNRFLWFAVLPTPINASVTGIAQNKTTKMIYSIDYNFIDI